ncbi:P-loop containing nucleoside triphosphate hydrolase protein [Rhodocollybia butyracea]|uniref:P-loop containing nucleoside triphosphate hydrolase protein n=1 Tax=Rhodocollybia butyracea TaxID=206335 RepID=A0A9P5Q4X5_9AGAR|nr:P-loop containing nucleoside triphosphate hydrolase protein [Rhodocollybia butyracea]
MKKRERSTLPRVQSPGQGIVYPAPSLDGLLTLFVPSALNNLAISAPIPTDISGIITLLFSLSALRDWLKLIVIGGFFETCRRIVLGGYSKMISAYKKSRDVHISTNTYGAESSSITLDGEDNHSSLFKSFRKLSYLPSLSVKYSLWYKGRYLTNVLFISGKGFPIAKVQAVALYTSILTRDRNILVQLLQQARTNYIAAQEHHMLFNGWKHVASRAKRSITSIILDPGVKEMLLKDARVFLVSKSWYSERGIPFRRGYLLWGAPGSGKSSLIHAIAGELGLGIFIISLSKMGLDDSALNDLMNQLPERCIALMKDIDATLVQGLTRERTDVPNPIKPGGHPASPKAGMPAANASTKITLSGLLNALDVCAQEGRILFATTNKYSLLDPALCRPDRMDVHIEFTLASKYQAKELFMKFFGPGKDEPLEKEDDESESGDSNDSGYSSIHDTTICGPKLSSEMLKELAEKFSDAIEPRQVSMAALQGYLMMYKVQPLEAVEHSTQWLQKERTDREAQGKCKVEEQADARATKEQATTEELEKEITQRVEKEVRERMERERFEKELREKIERDMTSKMESLFAERA